MDLDWTLRPRNAGKGTTAYEKEARNNTGTARGALRLDLDMVALRLCASNRNFERDRCGKGEPDL